MVRGEFLWPKEISADFIEKQVGDRVVSTFPNLPVSFYHALAATAEKMPDKLAFVDNWERKYTFRELLYRVDELAAVLHKNYGIKQGDRIGLILYNSVEFCAAFLALNRLGAIVVTLPGKYRKPEVLSLASLAEIQGVICDQDYDPWFEETNYFRIQAIGSSGHYGFEHLIKDPVEAGLEEPKGMPEDPVLIMFTSGTTSQSKGVLLKNYNVMHAVEAYRRTLKITQDDRSLIATPIYHITGVVALMGLFLYVGGTLWIHAKVDAKRMLKCIIENELTFIHASPTVFHLLLEERHNYPNIPSIRKFACGSSNMPAESIHKLKAWIPQADFHTIYGMTESSSPSTILPEGAADSLYEGSSGCALPGLAIKIVGDNGEEVPNGAIGEILMKGTLILERYDKIEGDYIDKDGWLKTGDIGYLNDAGYLWVVDRKKDMINRGGEKICSIDVENELHRIDGVLEAAVVGRSDKKYGEVPVALITPESGCVLNQEEITEILKGRLAKYKIPVEYFFVDRIPVTPNGKIDKKKIRQSFEMDRL